MSKPYFLSRVKLRDDVTLAQLRKHGLFASNEYQNHKLVWKIMSYADNQERDFIFRTDFDTNGLPSFIICSQHEPQHDNDIWDIETKNYLPILETGEKLKFYLRCNPTRTENTETIRKERVTKLPLRKTRRVDVILEARRRAIEDHQEWSNDSIELKGSINWLKNHEHKHVSGQNGFVETSVFSIAESSIQVERYYQVPHPKVGNQKIQKREDFETAKKLSILDVSGILTVENPSLFNEILLHGIGHGKAFGCGLMMVKRY